MVSAWGYARQGSYFMKSMEKAHENGAEERSGVSTLVVLDVA